MAQLRHSRRVAQRPFPDVMWIAGRSSSQRAACRSRLPACNRLAFRLPVLALTPPSRRQTKGRY